MTAGLRRRWGRNAERKWERKERLVGIVNGFVEVTYCRAWRGKREEVKKAGKAVVRLW